MTRPTVALLDAAILLVEHVAAHIAAEHPDDVESVKGAKAARDWLAHVRRRLDGPKSPTPPRAAQPRAAARNPDTDGCEGEPFRPDHAGYVPNYNE